MTSDLVAVPRSRDPQRLAQNLDLASVTLTDADMSAIATLDRGEAAARDSDAEGH